MNGEIGRWTYSLLFATLIFVLGVVGVVNARRASERWLASSLILQGILMTFVVGAAYVNVTGESRLGALVIVALLLVHTVWEVDSTEEQVKAVENKP